MVAPPAFFDWWLGFNGFTGVPDDRLDTDNCPDMENCLGKEASLIVPNIKHWPGIDCSLCLYISYCFGVKIKYKIE